MQHVKCESDQKGPLRDMVVERRNNTKMKERKRCSVVFKATFHVNGKGFNPTD